MTNTRVPLSHLPLSYDPTRSRRPERLLTATALVTVAAAVLTGCAGGPPSQPSVPLPETIASTVVDDTSPAAGPVSAQSLPMDVTFWQSGFRVHLEHADLDATGALLMQADIENLGSDPASFAQVTTAIELDGATYDLDRQGSDLVDVAAGGTAAGSLAFELGTGQTLSDAVLVVGSAEGNQVRIPFGTDDEASTNAPVDLAVGQGVVRSGSARVRLTDGIVRYEDPMTHREVDEGHAILDLTFDVSRVGGANATTFIGTDNLALRLPDGSSVAVRQDGISNPGELLAPGATVRDLHARFEVPSDLSGRYVLRLSSLTPDGAKRWKSVAFTVEQA